MQCCPVLIANKPHPNLSFFSSQQEDEVLGRIEASLESPLALENAGHALFDLYPDRRGNIFADEVRATYSCLNFFVAC